MRAVGSSESPGTRSPGTRSFARYVPVLVAIQVFTVFETAMAIAAIPTFMRVFHADAATVGWTLTAYLLVSAAGAATSGRLADLFGRRRVLIVVLVLGALGSLISVLAHGLWLVVAGRGVQGIAAAALPISFGLLRELLPARRVPLAMSLLGGVVPICSGIGSLIAGLLLDHGGWHVMFAVATVLGVAAAVLARVALPNLPGRTPRPRVDLLGGVLLAPIGGGLLFGVTQSASWGWTDPRVLGALALGLVLLAGWVWWERRTPAPMVDLRQFRHRTVALTTLATVAIGLGPMGAVSILSQLVLQLPAAAPVGLGLAPTVSGACLLIVAVLSYVGAAIGGRIAQSVGARQPLLVGAAIYAVGMVAWTMLTKSLPGTVGCLALTGIGTGFAGSALPILIVEVVPERNTGESTGINQVVQSVSVAAGIAITTVILAASTVPGTVLPTRAAVLAAFGYTAVLSLAALVLGLFIRRARPTAPDVDVNPAAADVNPATATERSWTP